MRDDRLILHEVLGGDARFISLKKNKQPFSSYTNPKNQKTHVPKSSVYGVLLRGDVFVLDLDCKKGDVEEQLTFFEEFIGFSRMNTFSVTTQSGGLHVYLRCPEGIDPKTIGCGSLRGYAKVFETSIELDTDLRGPGTNSFVVGPGSVLNPQLEHRYEEYFVSDWSASRLAEVSVEGIKRLANRRLLKDELRRSKNSTKNNVVFNAKTSINHSEISDGDVEALKEKLAKCEFKEYHRARSFIWRMLMCCHSLKTIAKVCKTLEIDRDSSKPTPMSYYEVMQDLERIHEKFAHDSWGHGILCSGKQRNKFYFEKDLEAFTEARRLKVANRTLSRSKEPRSKIFHKVISMNKVEKRLSLVVKSMESQQVRDALMLVRSHIQPLVNCGADRVVCARSELTRVLGISESRVAQAIRVLSKAEVITLKDRQKKGLASTFRVNYLVIDHRMSKVLQELVVGHGVSDTIFASFIFHEDGKHFEGVNIDAIVEVHDDYSFSFVDAAPASDLDVKAFDVAFRYSRREREARLSQLDQAPAPDEVDSPSIESDSRKFSINSSSFANTSSYRVKIDSESHGSKNLNQSSTKAMISAGTYHRAFEEKCVLRHGVDEGDGNIAYPVPLHKFHALNGSGLWVKHKFFQRYEASHCFLNQGGSMMNSNGLGSDFESEDRVLHDDAKLDEEGVNVDVDDWQEKHVSEEPVSAEEVPASESAEVPEATDELFYSDEYSSDAGT